MTADDRDSETISLDALRRQVGRAQRWARLQSFIGALGWCVFFAMLAALR